MPPDPHVALLQETGIEVRRNGSGATAPKVSVLPEPPAAVDVPDVLTEGPIAVRASSVRRREINWLYPGYVPGGMLTMLVGDPGDGKTLWTLGLLAGQSKQGVPSIFMTAEDALAETVVPRLSAAGANLDLIHFVENHREGTDVGYVFPDNVAELEAMVVETAAQLLVIDPISAFLSSKINSWNDQSVRGALAPLYRVAERHGVALICIAHFNKGSGTSARHRVGGSIGFVGAARHALMLARAKEDPDSNERHLAVFKSNLAELGPSLLYELEPVTLPATEDEEQVETVRLVKRGVSELRPDELLTQLTAEDREERSTAQEFLLDELAAGPRAAKDIKAAAAQNSITDKMLRTARSKLRVEHTVIGFRGPHWWRLPGVGEWPEEPGELFG